MSGITEASSGSDLSLCGRYMKVHKAQDAHFIMAAGPPDSMSDMTEASSGSDLSSCSFDSMFSRNCGSCMPCIICIIAGSCCAQQERGQRQHSATDARSLTEKPGCIDVEPMA